ncbi:MAG: Glycosyl transferase group 1 [Candidatus Woesebacteria bacterium GW2011_GWA1_37_7]|uniref:Glycosyl transferase group 1 n=1 Tax=Candidatus Woesebacteria bacterium GW2011_GWA1_37_7 TaxID=1618545 RepID=A0A0G0JMR0_9BACT|nr:MAG: Glycosyl transferase group 1 [Candidatus Woesebacteria bacterium GW2011_GWA1_37_7]
MRVALVTESGKADSVRGIGVYTKKLYDSIKQLKTANLSLDLTTINDPKLATYDILHHTDFRVYFSRPKLFKNTKTIVMIHDCIPLIYPDHYPPGIRGKIKLFQQKFLLKSVDRVVTNSETSKKDIVRLLDVPSTKIDVIYLAPNLEFKKKNNSTSVVEKYNLPKKFVLYVGDVNYNKNIVTLTDACSLVKIPLIIVGKQAVDEKVDLNHPENQSFSTFLNKYRNNPNVLRVGYVSNEELFEIYSLASVYCQPSFYEGFGIGVVNAFACGVPVVISKTQALVEIADGAALIVDPRNPKNLANKIAEILENKSTKAHLIKKGFNRVKDFSWEKTAKETLKVYKSVNRS